MWINLEELVSIPSSLGEEEGKDLSHCSPISMPLDGPT